MSIPDPDPVREATARLEALSVNLTERGFDARVVDATHIVHVVNRALPQVSDTISAAPASDGSWWFWWSWGDPVASIADLGSAAFKIAYVLNPIPAFPGEVAP